MTVHVHVERLVLDRVLAASADGERLGAILSEHLAGSLARRGVPDGGAALDSVAASPITLGDGTPATIGERLASSVDAAIARAFGIAR